MLENNFKIPSVHPKLFLLILAFVLVLGTLRPVIFADPIFAQVSGCTSNLQNIAPPLIDLGTETYTRSGISKQGGLYEGGTNIRPQTHLESVLSQVSQITPLDAAGSPDPNGKIVVVSMGMSNAAQEFGKFVNLVHTNNGVAEGLNPNLQIVNGAKGGQLARNWVNPDFYDSTWGWVESQLAASNVSANQVEIIWMKHTEGGVSLNFGDKNEDLKANLRTIIAMATDGRYPNLKVIYLSSRTRGYVDQFNPGDYNTLSPEPTAYEYGFAIKEIISEYIETSMNLPVPVAITWGPYLWIDGENERSDGLTWPPSMLVEDCTHPSAITGGGQNMVAGMLMDFFTTDETTSLWFLEDAVPTATPTATRESNPRATNSPTPTETATVVPSTTPTASPTAVPPTATTTPAPGGNIVFSEEADAAILSNRPTTNLGLSQQLSTDASPEIRSLMRFNVQNLGSTVNKATLRLFTESDSMMGIDVAAVVDNSWVETAVTYDNAPAIGNIINSSGGFSAGTWVEIDVTSYVTGDGLFSLAVSSRDDNRLTFSSREGANPPELVINLNLGSTPTPSNTPLPPDTPTIRPSPTPTNTPLPTNTPTPTNTPVPSTGQVIFLSLSGNGSVGGVTYSDEDVLVFDANDSSWSMVIDGSDIGLAVNDIDALHQLADRSFLLSLERAQTVETLDVDDSELIRFVPTSLGDTTAGTFERFLDGTDVSLQAGGEDIDGFGFAPDGRPLVSTLSSFFVGVSGDGKDLIAMADAIFGDPTSGTWSTYFDGSDAELVDSTEDLDALWLAANGNIYLSTSGSFTVTGASGDGASILVCTPVTLGDDTSCTYSLFWDGTANGLSGENIDGLWIDP